MSSLSRKIKLSPKTWFSLFLTIMLFGAIAVTQLATTTTRDNRSKAAGISLTGNSTCSNGYPAVNLSWTQAGYSQYDIYKDGISLASRTGSSSSATLTGLSDPGAIHNWRVQGSSYPSTIIGVSNTISVTNASGCAPAALPNLIIQNGSGANQAVTGPTTVTQGQTVSYTFRTVNIGTGIAGASTTVVEAYGSAYNNGVDLAGKQNISIGSLGAGGSVSHTFTTRWDTTGAKSMLFRVDAYGAVAESSEGDNSVYLTLTVNPAPDTTKPSITLTSPGNGQTKSGNVTLSATASDNVGVAGVGFYIDNSLITNDTSAPYSYDWNSASKPNGSHTIYATAWDAAGNSQQSGSVTINVNNTTGCGSNCGGNPPPGGGSNPPPGGGSNPPPGGGSNPKPPAKVVPPGSSQQPTASTNDIKLNLAPNSFLQGLMTISILVDGTGLAQNASVGRDGGTFVLTTSSLLAKNTSYTLTVSSKNSLIQKIGFKYVDNTSVSVATFVTGDFNSDNTIDNTDLNLLVPKGLAGGDSLYDINYDGVVNGVDYSLLLINLGKKGN